MKNLIFRYSHKFYNHKSVYCVIDRNCNPSCLHRCSFWSAPYKSKERPDINNVILGFETEQTCNAMANSIAPEHAWFCEEVQLEDLKQISNMMKMPLVVVIGHTLDPLEIHYHIQK